MAMILGHWHLRGYGLWAVEERASGALAKEHWGKGYATEGARRALHYAFTALDREHVISLIRPENAASVRVAERLGETLGGEALIYGISRAKA